MNVNLNSDQDETINQNPSTVSGKPKYEKPVLTSLSADETASGQPGFVENGFTAS